VGEVIQGSRPKSSPNAGAVISKAVLRAAADLGLSNASLSAVLGISEASISRLSRGAYVLAQGSKEYELALLVIRLYRSLYALVGGEAAPMKAWMHNHNLALAGVPAELARTVTGLVATVDYVDSARARI
jgi:hypothetical protein